MRATGKLCGHEAGGKPDVLSVPQNRRAELKKWMCESEGGIR